MRQIAPGLVHWTAVHPTIGMEVSSYLHLPSGALVDPLAPPEGVDAVRRLGEPRVALLTNRHHLRSSREFGVPVRCHEAGLPDLAGAGIEVEPFAWGEEPAPGVHALEVDAICAEETCLRLELDGAPAALAFADGVIRYGGELGFVPDELLGDDPEQVKRGVRAALRRLVDEQEFDTLLFAHGDPLVGGGREALARFAGA